MLHARFLPKMAAKTKGNKTMDVREAVESRRAVRDFLATPVPRELVQQVLQRALQAPSAGNVQPWHLHVVGGARLQELKDLMARRLLEADEPLDYEMYPPRLVSPYRERRYELGEAMYAALGIPREDKPTRRQWIGRNFQFFGAPLALFCSLDRCMGPTQFSDVGMLLQTIMLLLRAEGLHSCPQACWSLYPRTVSEFLGLPPQRLLFVGMAVGYANERHAVNRFVTGRAAMHEVVEFVGM